MDEPLVRFTLISREDCGLCEEMLAQLQAFCASHEARSRIVIEILDIDTDAALLKRYGHKIPVLLIDGEPLCHGHFDAEEAHRLLRSAP